MTEPLPCLLFAGQGAPLAGGAARLVDEEPDFARALDEAVDALAWPEARHLLVDPRARALDADTRHAQAAGFAFGWAAAALWRARGLQASFTLGHSLGEITAAAVAGTLDLPAAAALVRGRAEAMSRLAPGGGMAWVAGPAEGVQETLVSLATGVGVAALNAPSLVTISGDAIAVDAALDVLASRGWPGRRLPMRHAFHHARMEPALAELAALLPAPRAPGAGPRWVRALDGQPQEGVLEADYWLRQLREPVRFEAATRAASALGASAWVSCAPDDGPLGWVARAGLPGERLGLSRPR